MVDRKERESLLNDLHYQVETAYVDYMDGNGEAVCAMHPERNIGLVWHGGPYAELSPLDEYGLPTGEAFETCYMWPGGTRESADPFDEQTVREELMAAIADGVV